MTSLELPALIVAVPAAVAITLKAVAYFRSLNSVQVPEFSERDVEVRTTMLDILKRGQVLLEKQQDNLSSLNETLVRLSELLERHDTKSTTAIGLIEDLHTWRKEEREAG